MIWQRGDYIVKNKKKRSIKAVSAIIVILVLTMLFVIRYNVINSGFEKVKKLQVKQGETFVDDGIEISFSNFRIGKMSELKKIYNISEMDMKQNDWDLTDKFILADFKVKNVSSYEREAEFERMSLQSDFISNGADMNMLEIINKDNAFLSKINLKPNEEKKEVFVWFNNDSLSYDSPKIVYLRYPYKIELDVQIK